ncbi:hypothetical protein U1Q18_039413 [Sarracenia purpurea var. burkii]
MSEIAMLVAEEYERRVKNMRKNGDGGASEEIDLFSSASILARKVEAWSSSFSSSSSSSSSIWINNHFGRDKMKSLELSLQPKTQIAVAAINGFFSA